MGICTLIAAVSCRMSVGFFEPTIEWACGRIIVNDLMVLDEEEDFVAWEEAVELFCEDDWDGEDLWTEQGELLQCRPRPLFTPTPRWAEPKYDLASMTTAFICAPLHALRAAFGVVRSWLAPDCTSPTATCGVVPEGARPTSTRQRVMLNGQLVSVHNVDEECEWLGTDGRFAAEAEQWYDDYMGVGQSSREAEGFRRPMDTTHVDRRGMTYHVQYDNDLDVGPLLPGWEWVGGTPVHIAASKEVYSSKRWEKRRSEDRRLGRRIKAEVLGC